MTLEKILSSLCAYDKRNPDCVMDEEAIEDHLERMKKQNLPCYCDNCFYGRSELAQYILSIKFSQP